MSTENFLNYLAQASRSMIGQRLVKSAMTPIIMLCAISIPCFLGAAVIFREDAVVKYIFVIAAIVPMILAGAMYVYFAIFKTEKLQSEEFQIRQEFLQMVSKKSGRISLLPIEFNASAVPPPERTDGNAEGEPSK